MVKWFTAKIVPFLTLREPISQLLKLGRFLAC
jgi:hypothetical protein